MAGQSKPSTLMDKICSVFPIMVLGRFMPQDSEMKKVDRETKRQEPGNKVMLMIGLSDTAMKRVEALFRID